MEIQECQVCRSIDPIYVHHIPHRGDFAFLCTPCVLRHHSDSFCPIYFDVYDDSPNNRPSADSCLMCHRCPAMAHLTCLVPLPAISSAKKEAPVGFTPSQLDPNMPPQPDPNTSSPIFIGSTGGLLHKAQVDELL
ncbi:hypothetical protein ACS0TY_011039 [Phlomoides rotata]